MTFYLDLNSYYLSRFFNCKELKYNSFWMFYDPEEGIQINSFFPGQKVYSFLWEYADADILLKIDEWKRAFRRNNIEILPEAKLHHQNYSSAEKKVYLDCLETDFVTADKKFNDLTAYAAGQRFTQILTDENISFTDMDLGFLELTDSVDKFRAFLNILDKDGIRALILNGYHHRGELLKVCITKNDERILKMEKNYR